MLLNFDTVSVVGASLFLGSRLRLFPGAGRSPGVGGEVSMQAGQLRPRCRAAGGEVEQRGAQRNRELPAAAADSLVLCASGLPSQEARSRLRGPGAVALLAGSSAGTPPLVTARRAGAGRSGHRPQDGAGGWPPLAAPPRATASG